MLLVEWSMIILALSIDWTSGGSWVRALLFVAVVSLVGFNACAAEDDAEEDAKSVAAAVMGDGPPAASAPLLEPGVFGAIICAARPVVVLLVRCRGEWWSVFIRINAMLECCWHDATPPSKI